MAQILQMPFDWRVGAQYIANKYMPDWWQTTAVDNPDNTAVQAALQKQLYSVLPNLTQQQYGQWLNDYTWLTANQGKMPLGFAPANVQTPTDTTTPPPSWGGTSTTLPWDTTGQYTVPFAPQAASPNVWQGLTDPQVQRALAYYSSALPYAELAESTRRFGQEMDWKRRVDSWGTTGRAQLPSGNTVRRY